MSKRIFNKNLSKASGVILIRGGEIIDFFPQTNAVAGIGRSRGFGFVEIASENEANSGISQFNGQDFAGRNIFVNESHPREEESVRVNERQDDFDADQSNELNIVFNAFTQEKQACYRNIDASQKEIERLTARSEKRQKRFEAAMQKLEGLLK